MRERILQVSIFGKLGSPREARMNELVRTTMPSKSGQKTYDIAIIGGAAAGITVAAALRRHPPISISSSSSHRTDWVHSPRMS
jgi:hypothetical protein